MSYTNIQLTEIKRVKLSILESIKKEPNQKFPCRGVRGTHEMPEFLKCGEVETNMMKLCQPCLETYEAAANKSPESTPLVAGSDVEQGRQTEQKSTVLSRLARWVSEHKVLTAVAVLGGVGLVAGATATAAVLTKGDDASLEFQRSNSSSVNFGNINYSFNQLKPIQPKPVQPSPVPQNLKKFPCSNFGNLKFYTPAKKNFALRQNEKALAGFAADKNSRIDLDMTGICEGEFIGSFSVSCGGQNTELLPKDFISQNALNSKMSGTACNSKIDTSLIFSSNQTQSLELDKDKMCDEGMIQGFEFKTDKAAFIYAANGVDVKRLLGENLESPYIHEVKVPSNLCKELFDYHIFIECRMTDKPFGASITLKKDLTKGAKPLDLGACSVTSSDADLPRKVCMMEYDAFMGCKAQS